MKSIDKSKPHTQVGGKLPLFYMQNGFGFNRVGELLGLFDEQGNAISLEDVGDDYGSMKVPALRELLAERGIEVQEGAKKADLVDMLDKADGANEQEQELSVNE